MKEKKDIVSIIIPVYNVYEYLSECVKSVLEQTYADIEIVLVDDGSSDGSGELCDEIQKKDELSDARNVGILNANGSYIFFLDSDDIIDKKTIECMMDLCEKNSLDIAISPLKRFVNTIPVVRSNEKMDIQIVNSDVALKEMLLHHGIGHEACGKLFRKELWSKRSFPVGQLYEDYSVMYDLIMDCKNVGIFKDAFYYYRIREGSIMNTKLKKRELQILEVSETVTSHILQKRPEVAEYALYLQLVTYLQTMKRILEEDIHAYRDEQKIILDFLWKNKFLIIKKWVKIKDKIKILSLLLNKKLFIYIYLVGEKQNQDKIL